MAKDTLIFVEYKYYEGRGNWDRELIKRLAEKNYEIHAITCPFLDLFKYEEKALSDLGIIFHFMPFNKIAFSLCSFYELFAILAKNKSVLYIPSTRLLPFYYLLTKIFQTPVILSLQGGEINELMIMPEFEDLRKKKLLFAFETAFTRFREWLSAKLADQIIVISQAINKELLDLEIPSGKISLIYYSIDIDKFKKDGIKRKEIRDKFGIKESDVLINYTARLSKSVHTKLWSAEMLLQLIYKIPNQNLKVIFVGGGDGVTSLKSLSKNYGIQERVIFTDFIPYYEIPHYLSASDIFWFVMRDPLPTYGLALLEAMSCQNIVIANKSGSMMEIVTNGFNGFLVEPNMEKLLEVLNQLLDMDNEVINSIKKNARTYIEDKHSWHSNLPKIIQIMKKYVC